MSAFRRGTAPLPVSASEQMLFGGALRWESTYVGHGQPLLRLSFWSMARQFPQMIGTVARASWQEDPKALLALLAAELGQGLTRAFLLVATNQALIALFAAGPTPDRIRHMLPALSAMGAVSIFSVLLSAVSVAASGQLEPKVERVCTARFYRAAVRVELATLEDKAFHRKLDAGRMGTDSVRQMLGSSVAVINSLIGLVAAASVLSLLHPLLVLMLVLIAVPKGWGAVASARRQYESRHAWLDHRRAMAVITNSLIGQDSAAEIRVHGAGHMLTNAYDDMSSTVAAEQRRLGRAQAATETIASAASGIAALAAYGVLWWLLASGGMPLAIAGTAVIAVRTSSGNLASLVSQMNRLYEEAMYLGDLEDACTSAQQKSIPIGGAGVPSPLTEIRLQDVSFTYPNAEKPALHNVSLTIPKGKVVALVGENGSGKTTLSKLVAGLYLPSSGALTWNGIDIREADRDQVFDQVAVLGQDFPRWPMTARTNVHIGRSGQPLDQGIIDRACVEADAMEMINTLPYGWDSLVVQGFERGTQISGGQWQRLGSARARYRRAPLLIVDEPTSALDPKAEVEAFQALRSLTDDGTTVLLITHRLAATATADLIYVLDNGCLLEQGTHAQLMALPAGHYRSLYEIQAAQYGASRPLNGIPNPSRPASADADLAAP